MKLDDELWLDELLEREDELEQELVLELDGTELEEELRRLEDDEPLDEKLLDELVELDEDPGPGPMCGRCGLRFLCGCRCGRFRSGLRSARAALVWRWRFISFAVGAVSDRRYKFPPSMPNIPTGRGR